MHIAQTNTNAQATHARTYTWALRSHIHSLTQAYTYSLAHSHTHTHLRPYIHTQNKYDVFCLSGLINQQKRSENRAEQRIKLGMSLFENRTEPNETEKNKTFFCHHRQNFAKNACTKMRVRV